MTRGRDARSLSTADPTLFPLSRCPSLSASRISLTRALLPPLLSTSLRKRTGQITQFSIREPSPTKMRPLSVSLPPMSGRSGGGGNGAAAVGSPPPPSRRRRISISPKHVVLGVLLFVVGFIAMRHQSGGGGGRSRSPFGSGNEQQQWGARYRKGAFSSSGSSSPWARGSEGMLPGMGGIRSEEADAAAEAVAAQALASTGKARAAAAAASSSLSSSHHHAPSKTCSELLNAPKVALMFLTRGEMPHEPAWAAWLQSARGLVPLPVAAAPGFGGCGPERTKELVAACGSGNYPSSSAAALLKARKQGQKLAEASSITGMAQEAEKAKEEAEKAKGGGGGEIDDAKSTSPISPSSSTPSSNPIVSSQHLFSVYVNAPPDFKGYPPGSAFEHALVDGRVAASWGGHDLVDAARSLLRAALRDPFNERFVLLSESGAPTMAPALVYMQLLGSRLSRINACEGENNDDWRQGYPPPPLFLFLVVDVKDKRERKKKLTFILSEFLSRKSNDNDKHRWHPAMARPLEKKEEEEKKKGTWGQGDGDEGKGDSESETKESTSSSSSSSSDEEADTSTFVPEDKWRKSSQWASLTRKHAAAVVADTKIDATFRSLCHFREWDAELGRKYMCFSDEHYIPTLLAIRGWDSETDCFGYNVHTDWTEGGPHPVSFGFFPSS